MQIISEYLTFDNILRLASVNRTWYQLFQQEEVWKNLSILHYPDFLPPNSPRFGWKLHYWLIQSFQVVSFGNNSHQKLCSSSNFFPDSYIPKYVGLFGIRQVCAGNHFSLILDFSGRVWIFGNWTGWLEDSEGDSEENGREILVSGGSKIMQISVGLNHGLLLDKSGRVWSFGANVSITGYQGNAITEAIYLQRNPRILETLLSSKKAEEVINLPDVRNGETPLATAVRLNYTAAAKILIAKKVLVQSYDNYGQTPLMYAIDNNNLEIAQLLLKLDSSPQYLEAEDSKGRTALLRAVRPHSADSYQQDLTTLDFIEYMSWQPNPNMIQLLLKSGADPNHPDQMGDRASSYLI